MVVGSIVLGIETAVAGGSLCVFRGGRELAAWTGEDRPLRAEDISTRIQDLLQSAGVHKRDLTGIVVSSGPGSFTGIRVGIATALGLKNALNVELSSFSAIEAMADDGDLTGIAAVPMGRGAACAQRFTDGSPIDRPFNIEVEHLRSLPTDGIFLVHSGLSHLAAADDRVTIFGDNLARSLVKISSTKPRVLTEPIFLSRSTTS